ncbi:MAG: hypothetical protein IPQ16_03125 [Geobacteraceae bacterium]|nr:hypothetical protein [Geobacteraceae bacterium]
MIREKTGNHLLLKRISPGFNGPPSAGPGAGRAFVCLKNADVTVQWIFDQNAE